MLVLHNMVCKADAVRKGLITFAASDLSTCSAVNLVAETPGLPLHKPRKGAFSVLTNRDAFSRAPLWCVTEGVTAQAKERSHKEDTWFRMMSALYDPQSRPLMTPTVRPDHVPW